MALSFRLFCCALVLTGFLLRHDSAATQPPELKRAESATDGALIVDEAIADDAEPFQIPENEKPFWESAQAFLNAYANGDSAAIGELFTEEAEFFDEFGERTIGRAEIVQMFQSVFDSGVGATIDEINVERVRFLSETVVLEEGIVIATAEAGGAPYRSRYVALHTKGEDGSWRINTLKDYPREEGERVERLAELSWLVGEWVNESHSELVKTDCRWSDDGNYLLRRFTVQVHGEPAMEGVQRIGWDPVRKQIRSWTFDSHGGFFDGFWTKIDNQWLISISGVNAEGENTSALAIYTVIDAEMIHWEYRDLIIGGEMRDNQEPVLMVRPAPAPQAAAAAN